MPNTKPEAPRRADHKAAMLFADALVTARGNTGELARAYLELNEDYERLRRLSRTYLEDEHTKSITPASGAYYLAGVNADLSAKALRAELERK